MSNQEKFDELLDTVKTGACFAGTLALGTLGLACEGAGKLADAVKLRYRAARVEGELDGELLEIGEMAYAARTGGAQDSEAMEEKMRGIDALKGELDELNSRLGRREERPVCPVCGAPVEKEDHYCRNCGEKLD